MRNKRNKAEKSLIEKGKMDVVSSLQLPKDLMLGAVNISITGQYEAFVENYRGIIEYTEELIRVQTKTCRVSIIGKRLKIDYFTNVEMKVVGEIFEVKYHS